MKKLLLIVLIFSGWSCQQTSHTNPRKTTETETIRNQKNEWQLNEDASTIYWTGYKTTDKIPVTGSFQKFKLTGIKTSPDLLKTIENARIHILVNSIFSNEEIRDKKLVKYLFETMVGTEGIDARIEKIDKNNKTAQVNIYMNNIEKIIPMQIQTDEEKGKIILLGKINLIDDFKAEYSLNALHQACYDLHTGKDGISKTWPEVAVKAELVFEKP